ncbi:hypothetical protein K474DRAFT_1704072 [Panus rudis PR-1116 ss-1]|nr:hypothetical protein K474DRAFT_1704072 [Panus rudis PR-1116 ss-1]
MVNALPRKPSRFGGGCLTPTNTQSPRSYRIPLHQDPTFDIYAQSLSEFNFHLVPMGDADDIRSSGVHSRIPMSSHLGSLDDYTRLSGAGSLPKRTADNAWPSIGNPSCGSGVGACPPTNPRNVEVNPEYDVDGYNRILDEEEAMQDLADSQSDSDSDEYSSPDSEGTPQDDVNIANSHAPIPPSSYSPSRSPDKIGSSVPAGDTFSAINEATLWDLWRINTWKAVRTMEGYTLAMPAPHPSMNYTSSQLRAIVHAQGPALPKQDQDDKMVQQTESTLSSAISPHISWDELYADFKDVCHELDVGLPC